ncbi:putative ubiquitin associated and SH3 domain-containing protein B [Trichinella spiralis]|uniref:putative ubiquitin associated and SH3 domain-containing protein B n=1 Tax=Trichinella spiralis TaxID=6334 RepID=UPI0001EFB6F8|nr:putative ubiquitin associated and SH3 domain-containing protein B [Trichinella spiralis]
MKENSAPKSNPASSKTSGSTTNDDATMSAMLSVSGYSMMSSVAGNQCIAESNELLNQSGPGISKEVENAIVKKIEESKPQPTESEDGTGRRVILLRNAERMDRIFPEWVDMAFNEQGKYRPYDLNQPLQIPFRSGDFWDYRFDSPITELGNVMSMMVGRTLKLSKQQPYKIFVSPSLRCIQTAHCLLKCLSNKNLKMCIEPALFEWLSWYETLPNWLSEKDLLSAQYKIDVTYKPILSISEIRQHRNETSVECYQRCINAFKTIMSTQSENGNILFIVHSLTMDAITRYLNKADETNIPQNEINSMGGNYPYCSILFYEELNDKSWRLSPTVLPSITFMKFNNALWDSAKLTAAYAKITLASIKEALY